MTRIGSEHAHFKQFKHDLAAKGWRADTETVVKGGKHHINKPTAEHVSNKERQAFMSEHAMTNSHTNTSPRAGTKKAKMGGRTKNQKKKSAAQHPQVRQEILAAELEDMGYGEFLA